MIRGRRSPFTNGNGRLSRIAAGSAGEAGPVQCRIAIGQDEAALTDIHDLVAEMEARKSREVFRAETISGLKHASAARRPRTI